MSEEPETFNERKSPELQHQLEMAFSSSKVSPKVNWLNRLLETIGRYFGLY